MPTFNFNVKISVTVLASYSLEFNFTYVGLNLSVCNCASNILKLQHQHADINIGSTAKSALHIQKGALYIGYYSSAKSKNVCLVQLIAAVNSVPLTLDKDSISKTRQAVNSKVTNT